MHIYLKGDNMPRNSHRVNIDMVVEYGKDKANEIKNRISESVKKSLEGDFIYSCSKCNSEFKSNKRLANKIKYCSDLCRGKGDNCDSCGKWVNKVRRNKGIFCNHACYATWLSDNKIQPPQNKKRLENANSPEAKAKSLKTRIKKGIAVDTSKLVEGMTYKEYVKKVRHRTKMKRLEIYDNWDGYDHYDGKYIKDNFKLHYTNGDYPTIDHKVSVLKAFNDKWTINEVCELDNLVVTTKRNNSRKSQKDYLYFKKLTKK